MKTTIFLDALARAALEEFKTREEQDVLLEELQAFVDGKEIGLKVTNILRLLDGRKLLGSLPQFIQRFTTLREQKGISREATVTTAEPLKDTEINALRNQLEKEWRMPVRLSSKIDAKLIGGFRVDATSWRYDATVQGTLQRFSRHLLKG